MDWAALPGNTLIYGAVLCSFVIKMLLDFSRFPAGLAATKKTLPSLGQSEESESESHQVLHVNFICEPGCHDK